MENKFTVIAMIMVCMIGMTGIAMAGSTTQTYVGDGSYTTSWNGNSGTMNINTYTSNGQDHLTVDYRHGYSSGSQDGSTNGWSVVNRNVHTDGYKTSISAITLDNSGDLVAIDTTTKYGMTLLDQTVYTDDDVFGYDVNGVASRHFLEAAGWKPSITVYTQAGDTSTIVDINGQYGYTSIGGIAATGSGYGYTATGQMFYVEAHGWGNVVIATGGDYVGSNVYVQNGWYEYPSYANGMTYIELNDNYRYYDADGYIYAIGIPSDR